MSNRSNRTDHPKADPELLTRTSWINAELAYRQVKRGRANGNTCALWLRLHLQKYLYSIGCLVQLHCGKVTFLGLLLLSLCCVGLKTGHLETNVEELWVEEGGRLEKELQYMKDTIGVGSGTSYELIIQSPKKGVSLLNMESVLFHYQAVQAATKIKVDIDGLTWSFKDICYTPSFPVTENSFVDMILESILPCVIITPIDCFWEGSRLLGPDPPVLTGAFSGVPSSLTWENLDPQNILQKLEASSVNIPLNAMRDAFQRAGITTGYQEKPCLNPKDLDCPKTAANYNSSLPDLSAEFTKGCSGFATKYMQWEHDLIFGGIKKNKTGHIVRVEAFQSILQLMAEKDLFQYYEDNQKVSGIDWTQQKARAVLEAFQRKFSKIMNNFGNETNKDNLHGFSTTSLMDMMKDLSNISVTRVVLGYVLMFIYACVSLLRWNDAVNSQSGIGMAGVILVSLSVAAGLGICSVLGINFNASTTQIIPFLTLGLGVDDMFLIAHTYFENVDHVPTHELTGEVLKRSGVTVLLTSFSNMLAFFTAAIIPIPALRAFTLQAGILVLFNLGSVLLVYPAIVSLDLVRREDKRIDVFCCFQSSAGSNDVIELQPQCEDLDTLSQHRELTDLQREPSPPPPYTASGGTQPPCYDTVTRSESSGAVTTLAPNDGIFTRRLESPLGSTCPSTTSSRQCLTSDNGISCKDRCVKAQKECLTWTLTCLAAKVYAPFLQRTFVKVTVLAAFLVFLILGAWGTAQVKDGLDLTDIVPRETAEFQFLEAQSKYFGFYSINMITKGDFDYANNQQLLYDYHNAFSKVKKIIKREDNTLTPFWLELFRQWLLDLQNAFDKDKDNNRFSNDSWLPNASEDAILAYKLLIQTGDVNNPYNKNLATKNRLVDDKGIINPSGFYNYLSAWTTNDVMAYTYSMANFHPLPKGWQHDPTDGNLEVYKSQLLEFTQLPFYLTNLSSTEEVIEVITEIRKICDDFSSKGLPNFPSGVPFTFYEQYINLRFYLMLSLICVLVVTFVVLTVVLMNPWIAAIVVIVLGMMIVELFGFMGLAGIKLSAVPAVILIVSVGIGVEFTLHLAVGFITAIGSRNRRMAMALEHTFTPVVHGAISTFLGILMLVGTEFDFIVKYFFNVLGALVLIGLLNGLMLLPVILSILGPQGEVIPKDNADCLASPTPEPSPKAHRYSGHSRRSTRRIYPRVNSDISLSTISEEPTQYSSHEIIVQPEVVVETTTLPGTCHDTSHHTHQIPCRPNNGHSSGQSSLVTVHNNRYNSSPPDSPPPPPPSHFTRVKATATVKVEVHTPIPGCVNQEHTYKSKRRKTRESDNISSGSSDSDTSWHKHSSHKDTSSVCERHHCNNPGSCSNRLQPSTPQRHHRRSSRGNSSQSGKSSGNRQNQSSRGNREDDSSDHDCSQV
nr:protein patched-like protein 1-like [Biomphalaria glabrata]